MSVTLATLDGSLPAPKLLHPLGLWVLMAALAVANGVFRELVLIPRTGEYGGHVLSTAILVAAILLVSFAYFTTTAVGYTRLELLAVGVAWTVLTVGFEFLVGYLEEIPVSETLGQYNVLAGQVWILVPLTLLTAPLLFGEVLSG
ncbi:MAG: hypothetical protein V5A30_05225 [Haloarculaceae archaeon]